MTDTKNKILDAALKAFSECGFEGAGTKKIASDAGVNEVTLFRIFGSKLNLLSEVIRKFSSNTAISGNFRDNVTWDLEKDLTEIGMSYLKMVDKNIHTILMMITESSRIKELKGILALSPEGHIDNLSWYLNEQIERGNCRKLKDVRTAAQSFFALLFEYCIVRLVTKKRPSYEKTVETYVDIFINGIKK